MKKFSVLVVTLFVLCQFALSQSITITADDMPNTGDVYLYHNAPPIQQFNANATGNNYTWDYSSLQSQTTQNDSFFLVLQTPLIYNFVFNNPFDENQASIASNLAALPSFGNFPIPVTLTDEYTYYREEADVYKAVGFAFTADYNGTGIPLPIQYNPVDKLYSFPLNSATPALNAQSAYNFQIPGLITFKQRRNRTTTVDGYGTLKLPNATLEVIRLKSLSVVSDSIRLDTLGGFWLPSQPRTEIEYKWLAQGYGEPVLTISGNQIQGNNFQVNRVRYRHFEPTAVWENQATGIKISAFPIPASNQLHIIAEGIEQIDIMTINGKLILSEQVDKAYSSEYIVTFGNNKPTPGLYLAHIKTNKGTAVLKIPFE